MTALEERYASPNADDDMRIFDAAQLEYVATHRHSEHATALSRSAKRAGRHAGTVAADRGIGSFRQRECGQAQRLSRYRIVKRDG